MTSTPQRRLRRTPVIPGLVFVAVALLAAGCGSRAPDVKPSAPIRLGSYEWPGSYWIDVASDKGWFAEAGLDVVRVDTNNNYMQSLDEVVAGRIDGMGFPEFDLVRYAAAGHDLVGIAALDNSEGAEALVARGGIRHLKELRGKRIALQRGTYLEYLLDVFAERDGVNINEFTLVNFTGDAGLRELAAGRVDAAFVWEPYVTQALQGGGEMLFSTADLPGLTYNVLSMRREFVNARPNDVIALLRVWQRSVEYIRENPKEACAIVARLVDDPVASVQGMMSTDRMLDLADNSRAFSYAAGFESLHGSWRRMNDFMIQRGLVHARVESPDYLDARFLGALD